MKKKCENLPSTEIIAYFSESVSGIIQYLATTYSHTIFNVRHESYDMLYIILLFVV